MAWCGIQSTSACFAVPQLISVDWNFLHECNQILYTHVIVSDNRIPHVGQSTHPESVKRAWAQSAQAATRIERVA